MRFLVTGGAGFLGSALANQLVQEGHQVTVLDDLSNGRFDYLHPAIKPIQGDITDIPLLWSLLQNTDCVYHLAARVSVAQSILHPYDYNRVNVGGTVSLMEAMRDTGVRRVVFTSSGAVYGQQTQHLVHETDLPRPDSPYAVSKLSAEQYIHTIGELWNIETVALRIFNAYGPRQSLPNSHAPVVPRFLQQILTGGSLVIFGDGTQARDFVYVSDVVDALVRTATAVNVNRQVINIGRGIATNLNDLINHISLVTGKTANTIYNRQKLGGVPHLVANISRAQTLLGYHPQVSLLQGLTAILQEDGRFQAYQSALPAFA